MARTRLSASCEPSRRDGISEVCALRIEDVQTERDSEGRKLDRGVLLIRDGKGGKQRMAPMSPTLLRILRRYFIAVRPSGYRRHQATGMSGATG